MHDIAGKIRLAVAVRWHAEQAMRRQFRAEALHATVTQKLRRLMRHCFENVKFYREQFQRAGLTPERIRTVEDLQAVPILTKQDLRDRFWDFLPRDLPPCRMSRTSGSTGVPVCILSDISSRIHNSAAVIRFRQALGIPRVGAVILSPLKTPEDPPRRAHWTFLQGVHKTCYVNPYRDAPTDVDSANELLGTLRRPVVMGIAPAVHRLAERIADGLFLDCRPAAVVTMGQTLTPSMKRLIESAFGVKVNDLYACTEAGDIAWECREHCGYHVNADNCLVEILKDGAPVAEGDVGEVVITNLNRYVMPIVRYRTGDLARRGGATGCPCGRRLPMLAEIIGRSGEDMLLPGGSRVPWNQLKSLMTHQQIRQYQLIQQSDGGLAVHYVPEPTADTRQIEDLLAYRYPKLLGQAVAIRITQTASIAPAASGKTKLVVCDYAPTRGMSTTDCPTSGSAS
jgi:phenylacetate-CoA ligase